MTLDETNEARGANCFQGDGKALNKGRLTIPDHLLNLWLPEQLIGLHVKLILDAYIQNSYSIYEGIIISVVPVNEDYIFSLELGYPKDIKALGYSITLLYENGTRSNSISCWWYYNQRGFFTKRLIEIF